MESDYKINLIISNSEYSENRYLIWIELLNKTENNVDLVITTKKEFKKKYITERYIRHIFLYSDILYINSYPLINKYLSDVSEGFRLSLLANKNRVRYIKDIKLDLDILNKFLAKVKREKLKIKSRP